MATDGLFLSGAMRMEIKCPACRAFTQHLKMRVTAEKKHEMPGVALFGVRTAREDSEGAINLFGEHDAGEFVRVGHGAERDFLFYAPAEGIREAVGISTDEDDLACAAVTLFA